VREQAVGRWLRQCEDRGARRWAIRCRWPDKAPSVPLPLLCRRSSPSDENSEETRGGGSKFESSTCGVEMHACGGLLLPYLGRADKQAADILAGLGGGESQSTFDGHTVASDYGGA
jgi:hypothetical protein